MNKKNKQIVPFCIIAAILIFVAVFYVIVSATYDEYKTIGQSTTVVNEKYNEAQKGFNDSKEKREEDELQLQSIKPVFESTDSTDMDNLGVFGTMFDEIIKKAQSNGLKIRSIEYDMRPAEDQIYINHSNVYNVCELKFFLVGTYMQLKTFLNEMTQKFPYLVSISKLNVTAFNGNTDYILISMSITLYSKKANVK